MAVVHIICLLDLRSLRQCCNHILLPSVCRWCCVRGMELADFWLRLHVYRLVSLRNLLRLSYVRRHVLHAQIPGPRPMGSRNQLAMWLVDCYWTNRWTRLDRVRHCSIGVGSSRDRHQLRLHPNHQSDCWCYGRLAHSARYTQQLIDSLARENHPRLCHFSSGSAHILRDYSTRHDQGQALDDLRLD